MKAIEYVASRAWAIRPDVLEIGVQIATREHNPEALQHKAGKPVENSEAGMERRDNVCIIPVTGAIFRYADWFVNLCGGTTVETIARDLKSAVDDPRCEAIVMVFDSPGGEVAGISELADQIRRATETKPVIAYVDQDCCSAAYWLASACSEIVCTATALLGSIGVVCVYPTKKDDPKAIEFVSSQSPNKRPDVRTEGGKAQVQAWIDGLADVFIATVAENRDMTPAKVIDDFGAGGLKVGAKAVEAGLADRVGTFESLLSELADDARQGDSKPFSAHASGQPETSAMAGWFDRLKGLVAEAETQGIDATTETTGKPVATQIQNNASETGTPLKPAMSIEDDPRFQAIQKQLKALEEKEQASARAAFFSANASKFLPANLKAAQSLYAVAQKLDSSGSSEGLTAAFEAFIKATPSHNLYGNAIPNSELPEDAQSVTNDSTKQAKDNSSLAELLKMTSVAHMADQLAASTK